MTESKNLKEAVALVNEEVEKYRENLKKLAEDTDRENDPVLVEGETEKGYLCQLMVDPKDAARIMLDYDYPKYKILGADAPEEMWKKLGQFYGLDSVSSIDL